MEIFNLNTVDGNLTNTILGGNAVPTGIGFVCPLPNIATRVRPMGEARVGTVQAPFILSTSSTASNPSSFQTGDTSIDNVALTVTHQAKRSFISAPEGNLGLAGTAHVLASLVNDF